VVISVNILILREVTEILLKMRLNAHSEASLLAAILYQGNHDRNHKLWNTESTENIYSICKVLLLEYKHKVHNEKLK
jgi:hypothetical protein